MLTYGNRRERRAARKCHYTQAAYYQADHVSRWAAWRLYQLSGARAAWRLLGFGDDTPSSNTYVVKLESTYHA